MVIERAELYVNAGQEDDFEAALGEAKPIIDAAPGAKILQIARGVENPSTYLLLIEWDSLETHMEWRETENFGRFREIAGPFFSGPPNMEHFAPLG